MMALSGHQVADTHLCLEDSTRDYLEFNHDGDVSSGSMSLDLEEMWRYGCPKSPDWDCVTDHLRHVLGSPLWASVREFLTSDAVLYMCTTAVTWNIAEVHGPLSITVLFLVERWKGKTPSFSRVANFAILLPAIYGFFLGMLELGQIPDVQVGLMSRHNRDTWSRSTTSRYPKGWAPPASGEDTMAESKTGWRTVIQGLQDRSGLRIKEGLRSFIVVDSQEAVQVGDFEKNGA